MRKLIIPAALAVAATMFSCAWGGAVHVLHVNSLRGQIQATEKDGVFTGGFSLLHAALQRVEEAAGGSPVYTVAVFNAYHGTPEAHFSEGGALIDLMNAAGFDALVVGPREFYFGRQAMERLAEAASFPFIAANIRQADGSAIPFIKPFFYDPKTRVGLIGLAPRSVLSQNLAKDVAGLEVVDEVEATRAALAGLRELGARTVGLFAGGLAWGGPTGSADAATIDALLELDGISQYWFGSWSPEIPDGLTVLERTGGARVLTVQSGSRFTNGRMVAHTVMGDSPEGASFEALAVDSKTCVPDPSFADRIYGIESAIADVMGRKVAELSAGLGLDMEAECPMGDLLADIFRRRAGTEIFLLNSGKIRSSFQAGEITRKDLYDALPFGGNIVTASVSGAQLLRLLNRSCAFVGNPKAGRGYLQVSGLSFSWDRTRPPMDQVVAASVRVGGERLDPERAYSLGTEAYIFGGGDGYSDFSEMGVAAATFDETSILAVLEDALSGMGRVEPPAGGRVVRLPAGGAR